MAIKICFTGKTDCGPSINEDLTQAGLTFGQNKRWMKC